MVVVAPVHAAPVPVAAGVPHCRSKQRQAQFIPSSCWHDAYGRTEHQAVGPSNEVCERADRKSLLLLSDCCSIQAGGFTQCEILQNPGTSLSETFPAEAWHGYVPLGITEQGLGKFAWSAPSKRFANL